VAAAVSGVDWRGARDLADDRVGLGGRTQGRRRQIHGAGKKGKQVFVSTSFFLGVEINRKNHSAVSPAPRRHGSIISEPPFISVFTARAAGCRHVHAQ
jgi:hypothetical protein